MKIFLSLLLLGVVVYFMYRRAQDYGYPWEEQVVLSSYESNKRYRGGAEELYVHGEVRNRTRKSLTAEIECKILPEGMTLTPKATTAVALGPEEALPFDLGLRSRRNVTGAECRVREWSAGGGLEEKAVRGVRSLFDRLRRHF